ncbi:MAG TPA: hypothetical protein VM166_14840 [Gemmatimonadaceae bacterium]|nr:hypothetical protein [Gemmatimonadaceae bacterium]
MITRTLPAFGFALAIVACGGRSVSLAPLPVEPRCAALSDTLSKYVSSDALPEAGFAGDTRELRSAAPLRAGQSILVSVVVRPDGLAEPGMVEIVGANDPKFERAATTFAQSNRFVPGQVNGCNVLSRYSVLLR